MESRQTAEQYMDPELIFFPTAQHRQEKSHQVSSTELFAMLLCSRFPGALIIIKTIKKTPYIVSMMAIFPLHPNAVQV